MQFVYKDFIVSGTVSVMMNRHRLTRNKGKVDDSEDVDNINNNCTSTLHF